MTLWSDLSSVSVGDTVLEVWSGWQNNMHKAKVVKAHKLHLVLDTGSKYSRRSGSLVGSDTWSTRHIRLFDEKLWADYCVEVREGQMRCKVSNFEWKKADKTLIEQVYNLLPKKEPDVKTPNS